MNSGIYKIINLKNEKIYVGSAKNFEKRWKRHFRDLKNNKHSSIKLQRAYNKYGEENFKCEIIEELPYERNLILEREQYWINILHSKEKGYNVGDATFGDTISTHPNKKDILARISNTVRKNIEQMSIEERKQKWGKSGKSNGMYGKHRTDAEKQHLRECFLGKPAPWAKYERTKENRNKISKTRIEREVSKGTKNPFYGKHHSEKTKQLLSNLHKGKQPSNVRKVEAEGLTFESIADCAKYFKVCSATVIFRIKSKNWNWKYLI